MSKWRTITINLTQEQSRQLKALAGLKGLSQSAFFKHLLSQEVQLHHDLAAFMNDMNRRETMNGASIVADDPFTISGGRREE